LERLEPNELLGLYFGALLRFAPNEFLAPFFYPFERLAPKKLFALFFGSFGRLAPNEFLAPFLD
jgi:hypothetical protein